MPAAHSSACLVVLINVWNVILDGVGPRAFVPPRWRQAAAFHVPEGLRTR